MYVTKDAAVVVGAVVVSAGVVGDGAAVVVDTVGAMVAGNVVVSTIHADCPTFPSVE